MSSKSKRPIDNVPLAALTDDERSVLINELRQNDRKLMDRRNEINWLKRGLYLAIMLPKGTIPQGYESVFQDERAKQRVVDQPKYDE